MGKPTGFLEYDRQDHQVIRPSDRIHNYHEFHVYLDEEKRRKQAARCMNCGVPFCQSALELKGKVTGCPLYNLIPEWNDELCNGNDQVALSRLLKTNPFPEFTSRVCPALCEKACINGVDSQPVTIHDNEYFIIETAFENGWIQPNPPKIRSDKKIAIVGSGPSGLACAHTLNKRGHQVTVYEREDRVGGLLMYGIPNMKLEKKYIERRVELLQKEGIQFCLHTNVGIDITKEQLVETYDAVVLCCGAKQPRDIQVKNRNIEGVMFAVDYLTESTKNLLDSTPYTSAENKHVVIIGGGDTGNDCVGTAIRQHACSVTQVEMLPQAPLERAKDNPWPEWPNVLKTDYGQEEAIALFHKDPRIYETIVTELVSEENHITAVKTIKIDKNRHPIEGTEQILPCDLLLIAAGFTGVENCIINHFQLETTNRNTIATKPNTYQTNQEKIFVAGDIHRGQSLVVWAIAEGKNCAKDVDRYLMEYTNIE